MKTVFWTAAIYISLEIALRIRSPLMGMTGNSLFIPADKDGIVVFLIFIEQLLPDKCIDNLPVKKTPF